MTWVPNKTGKPVADDPTSVLTRKSVEYFGAHSASLSRKSEPHYIDVIGRLMTLRVAVRVVEMTAKFRVRTLGDC